MKNPFHNELRVTLSTPKIEDGDEFLQEVEKSQPLHFPWVSPPGNKEQFNAYLDKLQNENQTAFFLKLKMTNKIIGVVNINEIVQGCFQSGYLGYYMFHGYQRQGLMSEGLYKVLELAFSTLNLHRLEANIQPENKDSISLVKRAGFNHDGFSRRYLFLNDAWRDHERFSLTKEDFLMHNPENV